MLKVYSDMRVLALDTTTRAGSVALVHDDQIVEERRGDEMRTHAERLPRELIALADAHALALADVDLFAVAAGPGSFTGLRIGIATIQGLAFVTRRAVAAISALDALAHVASVDAVEGCVIAAWMDARRHEVFAALYRVSSAPVFDVARLTVLDPPSVGAAALTLARWRESLPEPSMFIGDGASIYADAIARSAPAAVILRPPILAGAIGRIAIAHARFGSTVDAAGIRPLYVRRPDVELVRERRE
jgi:tRNA threonylcarbamoyladenosine biosynthesis protein TsaB